jgi:TonB family protein
MGASKLSGVAVRGIHRLGLTVCVVGGMMLGSGVAFAVPAPAASAFSVQEVGESAQQASNSSQTKDNKVNTSTQSSENPSNPEIAGVHHPGDGIVPPKVLYAPDPEFSDKARSKKLGGTCVLSTLVDTEGKPHDVQIVKSVAEGVKPKQRPAALSLDEDAVKAVNQYRFQPATMQGKPVSYRVKIEVNFRVY